MLTLGMEKRLSTSERKDVCKTAGVLAAILNFYSLPMSAPGSSAPLPLPEQCKVQVLVMCITFFFFFFLYCGGNQQASMRFGMQH